MVNKIVDPVYVGIDQSVGGFGLAFYSSVIDQQKTWKRAFPLAKYKRQVFQLGAVEDWLIEHLGSIPGRVAGVAREGFSYGSIQGREFAGALAYAVDKTLCDWLPDEVCFPTVVAISHVKEFATGDGSADKEKVKAAIRATWGVELNDDNEADALVIARIRHAMDDPKDYTAQQLDVIHRIKNPPPKKKRAKKKS